jgi:hypothetical protein
MNGATGELVTILLEILRNILAGTEQNPKSLETARILEDIVIHEFDKCTDMGKAGAVHAFPTYVTGYLYANLSLPLKWINREIKTMNNDNGMIYAKQLAEV